MKKTPFPRPKPREDGRNSTFPIPKPAPGQRNSTLSKIKQNKTPREKARDKAYLKARREYLAAHPKCEFPGCTRDACDIHHVRGKDDDDLRCNPRWFKAACRECHNGCHDSSVVGERKAYLEEIEWKLTRHRGGEIDQESEEES